MRFVGAVILASCSAMPATADSVLSSADATRQVCVPTRDSLGRRDGQVQCKTGREWEQALAAHPERAPRGRIVFNQPRRVEGRWQF